MWKSRNSSPFSFWRGIIWKFARVDSIYDRWKNSKHSILKSAEEVLEKGTREARKPWTNKEALDLMHKRIRYENASDKQEKTQYKRLRNKV